MSDVGFMAPGAKGCVKITGCSVDIEGAAHQVAGRMLRYLNSNEGPGAPEDWIMYWTTECCIGHRTGKPSSYKVDLLPTTLRNGGLKAPLRWFAHHVVGVNNRSDLSLQAALAYYLGLCRHFDLCEHGCKTFNVTHAVREEGKPGEVHTLLFFFYYAEAEINFASYQAPEPEIDAEDGTESDPYVEEDVE